ncbi:MAG: phosphoenolpyruvate synthase, partial [Proteobacteria bacterium]|nr:phosphoenolpyruvate synthase [Pseudomonadota bacterium]
PAGFVVTTRAFTESLRGRLAGRDTLDEMRRRIVETGLGSGLLRELEVAYASLLSSGAHGLVVRSSAIDEDSLDQSWAGQQDSYIHVRGFESLLVHIKKCWASLFGDSALSYHAREGFVVSDPAMAVVVQRMVHADAAGVTFTVNPVNGQQDEMVHTFSYGLGEMVVSGGDADVFVVDRQSGQAWGAERQRMWG